jgi:putative transcriptional regulator
MQKEQDERPHLTGMLLVAMPGMADERFARSLVYLCAHSEQGAMGLIVNQPASSVLFPTIIEQLGIAATIDVSSTPVHVGGPVESSRGFVLHSPDYVRESTLVIDRNFALTATVDILKAMAAGDGPRRSVFALGYAGWAPGQLDSEIQRNGWLITDADAEIVYDLDNKTKWERAMRAMGIDPALLSTSAGHA